jgi:protein-S-isoprenylcysteine O-methyltransferase
MVLRVALLTVVVLFPVSEITLAVMKRANARVSTVQDRGSIRLLWLVIGVSICAAAAFQWIPAASIQAPTATLHLLVLGFMVVGLVVRWASILTLGRFFTVDVAVRDDHVLVETGFYRHVRHPSYSGLLLVFVGMGFFFANWLSLAALVVPITAAILRRIGIEERALRDALGAPYVEYCSRTKRFVPGLF